MSEPKDAKYFGARIGERCWYDDKEGIIEEVYLCCQTSEYFFGVKIRPNTSGTRIISFDGEGITFEPPKKKIRKELDVYVVPEEIIKWRTFVVSEEKKAFECPGKTVPAKLIFEMNEE